MSLNLVQTKLNYLTKYEIYKGTIGRPCSYWLNCGRDTRWANAHSLTLLEGTVNGNYHIEGYWYGGDYGGNGRFAANFPLEGYYHGDDYGHYYIDAVIPDATPDWKKSEILNKYGRNRDSHRSWKVYTGLYKNYNTWDTVVSSTKRPVATYSRNGIRGKYPKWILNKDSIDLVTGGFTLAEIRTRQEQVYGLDWNYNRANCNVGWGCNVVCTVSEWMKSGRHDWRDPNGGPRYRVTTNKQFPHGYGSKGEFFVG